MTPQLSRHVSIPCLSLTVAAVTLSLGAAVAPQVIAAQSHVAEMTERLLKEESRVSLLREKFDRLAIAAASITDEPVDRKDTRASEAALAARLAALERSLTAAGPHGALSISELERRLADARRRRAELTQKQAAEARTAPSGRAGLNEDRSMQGLSPVQIKLVKNRVIPLESPFFTVAGVKVKTRQGQTVDGFVIRRVQDGESAGDAIRANGLLDDRLRKADPSKHYVMLSVTADSIAALRVVVDELRRRNFAFAWDTGNDEPIVLTESQLRGRGGINRIPEGILPKTP